MTGIKLPEHIRSLPNCGAWGYLALSLLDPKSSCGLPPALSSLPRRSLVIARKKEEDLEDIADAISAWLPLFPRVKEGGVAFFGSDPQTRLAAQEHLFQGAKVALVLEEALDQASFGKQRYRDRRVVLHLGAVYAYKELLTKLSSLGYRRVDFTESPGEYAVRGAIVDFYPWEPLLPVRVLYDGDAIQSLRHFDPQTQMTHSQILEKAVVIPAQNAAADETLAQSLTSGRLWLAQENIPVPDKVPGVLRVGISAGVDAVDFGARPIFAAGTPSGLKIDAAAAFCRERFEAGYQLRLFSMTRGEDERIQEMLEDKLPEGAVEFLVGPLRQGFELPENKFAVLASSEIFGRSYRTRRVRPSTLHQRARVRWGELKRGDYVVHESYGVARYLGLEGVQSSAIAENSPETFKREDGQRRLGSSSEPLERRPPEKVLDCLRLEFRGGDALFVPMEEFKSVQKFIGGQGHRPRLSSMDTRSWKDVKERVKEGVRDLAEQLLKLQAERQAVVGHAFNAQSHMEKEFAESFPFEETPDQRKAIEEVCADMASPHPMDRVIVGDVGFGKTEVAMRAALKCVSGLKQAVLLVPTTILADQHTRTFRKRFAEYPVRIEMLSRFQTKKEQKVVLADAAAGKVDVLVGTHRLLQKDVRFKKLGLLIIDEEHRFGVRAKETMKALKKTVDCLMLSATPIPRTLHQCMSGLRKVSLIQSAPTGRQPIVTAVEPWSEAGVVSSIERELERGGQVYYVHNRVRSLPQTQKTLEKLLPGVRICMAHGQMKADALEKTMWEFFERKYDILLASSIIESGLDIPSVNTLLIENAQDFGLSQLYQLRGRIGRERKRAYCHLLYPADKKEFKSLSEEARKRLEAMRDFADLGSGFMLAMRDLEIRGAGDLLGAKQHGFLNAVGVEFYSELLETEIRRLQGRAPSTPNEPQAHLDVSLPAYIPEDYLPGDLERIQFYKRILAANAGEAEELKKELKDISGPLPKPVENLFRVMRIRALASSVRVRAVIERGRNIDIYFSKTAKIPMEAVTRWMSSFQDRIEFINNEEGDGLRVILTDRDPLEWLWDFLQGLKKA